jgi:hypothetical protein
VVRGRSRERARLQLARDVDQLVALRGRERARAPDELSGTAALGGCQRTQMAARQKRELEDRDDFEEREAADGPEHRGEATQLKYAVAKPIIRKA